MLKENKKLILVTGMVTLLPLFAGLLLWSKLPEEIATHFNTQGEPDGWSSRFMAVVGLPALFLAVHLFCAVFTAYDPRRKNISPKLYRLILLICPVLSVICSGAMFGYALGWQVDVTILVKLLVGVLFVIVGNYLPKCRRNYTIGIKLPWTLEDEENWNHTHRMAGWLWMAGGLFLILHAFFPAGGILGLGIVIGLLVLAPVVYSFVYYIRRPE